MNIVEVESLAPHDAWGAAMARVPLLSERELDVFQLLAKGASNRTIATRLAITERTAKAHVARILAKLGVESRLQAGITGFAWQIFTRAGHNPPHPRPVVLEKSSLLVERHSGTR